MCFLLIWYLTIGQMADCTPVLVTRSLRMSITYPADHKFQKKLTIMQVLGSLSLGSQASQIGHILLEYGNEHNPIAGHEDQFTTANLMRHVPSGKRIEAWQYFIVLDIEKKKLFPFFLEEK